MENAAQRDENDIIRVHTAHKEPAWYLTRGLPNSKGCLLFYNTFSPWSPPQRKKIFFNVERVYIVMLEEKILHESSDLKSNSHFAFLPWL